MESSCIDFWAEPLKSSEEADEKWVVHHILHLAIEIRNEFLHEV